MSTVQPQGRYLATPGTLSDQQGQQLSLDKDGRLKTASPDWEVEVARGNVSGWAVFEKYGKNPDIDTGPEDIWNGGETFTGFPTGAAETMEIFSSSANDTSAGTGARTVTIYNLLDDTGAQLADVTVSLNGTSPVSLGAQAYYRGGTRIRVITAGSTGSNEGTITLRHTTTTTNIFAVMPIGANQTAIAAYTVPLGKTLYLNRFSTQMSRANGLAGSALVSFRVRPHGETFQAAVFPQITDSQNYTTGVKGIFAVAARTDIKVTCDSVSDANTTVTADFGGYLIDN